MIWKNFIIKYMKNSFYAKSVLLYSAITAVSLIFLGIIVNMIMSNALIKKELDYESQAINSMGNYILTMERQFPSFLYNNKDRRYSDILLYLNSENEDNTYLDRAKIVGYLNSILNSNEDILDVILCKDSNGEIMSVSSDTRRINSEYDFAVHGWYSKIKARSDEITIIPPHVPEYMPMSGEKVLTYASNINYFITPQKAKNIGTLIINYKVRNFIKAVAEYRHLKGNIFVMDRNGLVIFDSSGKYTGSELPFYDSLNSGEREFTYDHKRYISLTDRTMLVNYSISSVSPSDEVLSESSGIRKLFYIVIAGLLFVSISITILASKRISKRVHKITEAMRKTESGILDSSLEVKGSDELDLIADGFNRMSRNLSEYIKQVYLSGLKQKSAELSALQSQINPHFLYNTLETLRMESLSSGNDSVASMIQILANIFRWNLKNKQNTILVSQEVQYLRYYLDLQKYRLKDRLEYSIQLEPSIVNCRIIKFSLQPILENAIQHGIERMEEGGWIEIKGFREDANVVFEISNSGETMEKVELQKLNDELNGEVDFKQDKIGLKNVHDRIRILFGDSCGFSILSEAGCTTVKVSFPALEGDNDV